MKISERILRGAEKGEYIGVDFDGTMFTYDKWVGWNVFGEPIKPMIERVQAWLVAKVPVRIVTARLGLPWARSETGQYLYSGKLINKCLVTGATYSDRMMIDAIQHHLVLHKLPRLPVQCFKDVGLMELWDDRAVQVIANTGRTLAEEHAAELAAQRGKQFLGASALDEFDPECIPGN